MVLCSNKSWGYISRLISIRVNIWSSACSSPFSFYSWQKFSKSAYDPTSFLCFPRRPKTTMEPPGRVFVAWLPHWDGDS